jgi:hypothetical protein
MPLHNLRTLQDLTINKLTYSTPNQMVLLQPHNLAQRPCWCYWARTCRYRVSRVQTFPWLMGCYNFRLDNPKFHPCVVNFTFKGLSIWLQIEMIGLLTTYKLTWDFHGKINLLYAYSDITVQYTVNCGKNSLYMPYTLFLTVKSI